MPAAHTATGRGKLIVFGEHAVVYGHPALACSLPDGARATITADDGDRWRIRHPDGEITADGAIREAGARLLDVFGLRLQELTIEVDLTIPVGAGLGSSAALSVALARCAASLRPPAASERAHRIHQAVTASEAVFHGSASGIDQQAAMSTGFFLFRRGDEHPTISPLDVAPRRWLVARVAPAASTSGLVSAVAAQREAHPALFDKLFHSFARVANKGALALRAGRFDEVGELMNINQGLLNAIGVSTPAMELACAAARDAGALGAKLTGAGGGGCVIVLPGDDPEPVVRALEAQGDVFQFTLPAP